MQSDLFAVPESTRPLAERMRPQNLDEVLGQSRILSDNSILRRSLETDNIPSLIFWGPPGCGKTSLAHVIEQQSRSFFAKLSAVNAGVRDVKDAIGQAHERRRRGQKTILFIDEIHRFNKNQQDALLGAVEDGTITLIGATTENPSFEINNALLSRCQLILFSPLKEDDLYKLFWLAVKDHPRGLGQKQVEIDDAVVKKLVYQSEGDARYLLNQIEWIFQALNNPNSIALADLEGIQYQKPLRYDKQYDEHYNLISALHKSVRGSDVHAALYWLHRMLQAGEDPRYLLRRLMRMAMEDIGLADPHAIQIATSCREAYDFLGKPEGLISLDQLTVYLSLAPKSNALEIAAAHADALVKEHGTLPVPKAFRPNSSKTADKLGYGHGYLYDHDAPNAYSGQDHLPQKLLGTVIYKPTNYGNEQNLATRLDQLKKWRKERAEKGK
ncbi:MAG: replication-associated recombination protein A [Fibrobacter sp.]|nr:replication-associated recombination protein A [Fibrobacter sp.]